MRAVLLIVACFLFCSSYSQSDWTVYNTGNSEISGNNVWNITCDGIHVYISTNGNGLDYKFGSNWYTYNTVNSDLPNNEVNPVYIDEFGQIWVGTDGGGIGVLANSEWTLYSSMNSNLGDDIVYDIEYDGSSLYWVATRFAGVHSFNGSTWTQHNTWDNTTAIAIDPNTGVIWAGTYNGGPGLIYYQNNQWNNFQGELPSDEVYFLDFDSAGDLWIGTFGGLAKYSNGNLTTWTTNNSPLPDNYIRQVAFDPYDGIWIATGNGGVARMEGDDWLVWDTANSNLPSNKIWSVEVQDANNVWVGMYDNGGAAVLKYSDYPEISGNHIDDNPAVEENIFVFPNPSSGLVNVQVPVEKGLVELFDERGNLVYSVEKQEGLGSIEINITNETRIANATYTLTFRGVQNALSTRMILLRN